jgi:hypothetical protein
MIIACSHPNGLNLGGVIARGPAVDPQSADKPEIYGSYALSEVPDDDRRFVAWCVANVGSQIVEEGVVVWGSNRDEVRLKIMNGRIGRGFVA